MLQVGVVYITSHYQLFSHEPTGSTIPPSNVKKTVSVGSPGPARLTAVTFAENGTKAPAENGTKAPGWFTKLQSIQETNRNQ